MRLARKEVAAILRVENDSSVKIKPLICDDALLATPRNMFGWTFKNNITGFLI